MSVDTLDDVIEEICDVIGVYGAHGDPEDASSRDEIPCEGRLRGMCRVCASAYLRERIQGAVDVERKLRA